MVRLTSTTAIHSCPSLTRQLHNRDDAPASSQCRSSSASPPLPLPPLPQVEQHEQQYGANHVERPQLPARRQPRPRHPSRQRQPRPQGHLHQQRKHRLWHVQPLAQEAHGAALPGGRVCRQAQPQRVFLFILLPAAAHCVTHRFGRRPRRHRCQHRVCGWVVSGAVVKTSCSGSCAGYSARWEQQGELATAERCVAAPCLQTLPRRLPAAHLHPVAC